MLSLKPQAEGTFEKVWAPQYESDTNLLGTGSERGARALIKRAYAEQVPVTKKEAAFDEVYANPGPQFRRVAFSMQTALKDRNDYVSVGRKLLLTDELP